MRSARRVAASDQVLAVLRTAGGFPLSTRQLADELGERLVSRPVPVAALSPRPSCWPDELGDPEDRTERPCVRCGCWHRQPVWQAWCSDEVRVLLGRLEAAGTVERVVLDGARAHYWRSSGPVEPAAEGENS